MKLSRFAKFRAERFGGVLFDTSIEKVFALNPTAAAVIQEIKANSVDETTLIDRLRQRFNDSSGTIERDIRALIADLRQKRLIEG